MLTLTHTSDSDYALSKGNHKAGVEEIQWVQLLQSSLFPQGRCI